MKKKPNRLFASKASISILSLFFLSLHILQAQVKIGDNPNSINSASVLELESNSRALVLTRVTNAEMESIIPLQGAIIYNIDEQCIFYFDSSSWINLCTQGGQIGNGATLVDNRDNTFTFTDSTGNETVISFSGSGADIATLVDNGDATFTFTDANGDETLISFDSSTGSSLMGQPGSIFFAGIDMTAIENNNELFWDNINNRMGIGSNTNLNNKLTVTGDIGATQLLLNNANQDPTPLIIRGSGQDQRMIAFQDENLGKTLFNINFRAAGLNIDEVNKQHRLFIKILGGLGIETAQPTETLDVAGTFRVRQLDPSLTTDNFVTVDAEGVFHRSVTPSSSGKSSLVNFEKKSAKWTNNNTKVALNFGSTVAPIFAFEEFKDDENNTFTVKGNSLIIKSAGRYEVHANLSLIGANISFKGQAANISARINVNGSPKGSISVAANNGSTNSTILSSLQIVELLELNEGDVITVKVQTDALPKSIHFNDNNSSNFTITKYN